MNALEVWLCDDALGPDTRIGSLTRTTARGTDAIRFEYEPAWLRGKAPPHPFGLEPGLPPFTGPHYAAAALGQLPGIFQDLAPDRWGRVLMERREAIEAREAARPIRPLRDWDFLVGVNDATRQGALRLRDPASAQFVDGRDLGAPPLARLRDLEALVARLEEPGVDALPQYREWLMQLVAPGASLGGARPKASCMDEDGALWLAKFPAADDRRDIGRWEMLAHRLARQAGVEVPEARSVRYSPRGHTFLTRRFDRVGASRRLYASAMTLTGRVDGEGGSYLDIVEAIELLGDPANIARDLEQLYRRVLFSVLVGNRDDHLRNHGFLRGAGGWRLSPAFDINPNPDRAEHALAIDEANPTPDGGLVAETAPFYRVSAARARAIGEEVRAAVASWPEQARQLGVPRAETELLATVIDPGRRT